MHMFVTFNIILNYLLHLSVIIIILHSLNFEDSSLSPTPFEDWKLPVKVMLRTGVYSVTTRPKERERETCGNSFSLAT
jgi:hypothetical protein